MAGSSLNADQLRKLLATIRELSQVSETMDFHSHVAYATRSLVDDDWISCESFTQGSLEYIQGIVTPTIPGDLYTVFQARAIENPMIGILRGEHGGRGMATWGKVLGDMKLVDGIPLYHDFYKLLDIENQLAIWSFEPDGTLLSYCLSRNGDYSDQDQETIKLLQPHLINAYRTWRAMDDLRQEPTWLQGALEEVGSGVVLLDHAGRVVRWTPLAEQLMGRYFRGSRRSAGRLPKSIDKWVSACLPIDGSDFVTPGPYLCDMLTGDSPSRLSIRLVRAPKSHDGGYLLVMHEQSSAPSADQLQARFGLSQRRSEVLHLILLGKTNSGIAEALGLSVGTVRKHVELLFRDLDVTSRAEAVGKVAQGE